MFKKIILFTLIIILIPLLIVGINDKEKIIYKIKYGSISNKKVRVKRTKTNEVVETPKEVEQPKEEAQISFEDFTNSFKI